MQFSYTGRESMIVRRLRAKGQCRVGRWMNHHGARAFCAMFTAAILLTIAPAAAQDTIHVPGDYAAIQQAINAAANGDEIIVAPGVYSGRLDILGKAVHLRSSVGPQFTTIQVGSAQGSVITITSGEGPDTIIEGFTITGGSGTYVPGGITVGGGMMIYQASPTIINCTFASNSATYGGAIDVEDGSPTIDGCTFIANEATLGGAVAVFDAVATVSNGAFTGNTAVMGGAVYLGYFNSATITSCGFNANHASFRGGAIHIDDGSPVIEQSSFTENTAWQGGAVSIVGAKPIIVDSAFTANFGEDSGGAIYNEGASPLISGCTFDANATEPEVPSPGSTVVGGGAIGNWWSSTPVIEDSTFMQNTSSRDGGAILYRGGSHVTIRNSTFSNNFAVRFGRALAGQQQVDLVIEDSNFDGAALTEYSRRVIFCLDGCRTTISDSTFTNFHDPDLTQTVIVHFTMSELHVTDSTFENNNALLIANSPGSATSITGSTFANNTVGFGTALVGSFPIPLQLSNTLFCGTDGENLAGNWDDLGGNEFLEKTCPWDEQGDSIPGDLNGDGVVDGADLLILLSAWGECADPGNCPADLNGDGVVDGADLLILLANWGNSAGTD